MILSNLILEINGHKAKLSQKVVVYRGDIINLAFTIKGSIISSIGDGVEVTDAGVPMDVPGVYALMLINYGESSVEGTICEGNTVRYKLTAAHTSKIGTMDLQIVIMDTTDGREILHTPPFSISVNEPIFDMDGGGDAAALLTRTGKQITTRDGTAITTSHDISIMIFELTEATTISRGDYLVLDTPSETKKIDIMNLAYLFKEIANETPPVYTKPTCAVSIDKSGIMESGSNIYVTITGRYTQNDGGDVTGYRIYRNNELLVTLSSIQTYRDMISLIHGTSVYYRVEVDYAEGGIKDTNLGNPYPSGHVTAGTTSANSATIRSYNASYYGVNTNQDVSNSELTKVILSSKGFTYNNITINNGYVIYKYPENFGELTIIKDANGFNITESYTHHVVNGYHIYVLTTPVTLSNATHIYS